MGKVEVTRQELYNLVWSKPMSKLALELRTIFDAISRKLKIGFAGLETRIHRIDPTAYLENQIIY